MTEVTYEGYRQGEIARVIRNGQPLAIAPSLKLWNHSPTGFEWGYPGSGPAQLALALLNDATGNKTLAVEMHQKFKFAIVAKFPRKGTWQITRTQILSWVNEQQKPQQPPEVPAAIAADPPPMESIPPKKRRSE